MYLTRLFKQQTVKIRTWKNGLEPLIIGDYIKMGSELALPVLGGLKIAGVSNGERGNLSHLVIHACYRERTLKP